jgi:His/Glu/Gln/Arg/opine family amino acid ABC transporter permease subunit
MVAFVDGFWAEVPRLLPPLLVGFQVTLLVAVFSFVVAMVVGLLLALGKLSHIRAVRAISSTYVELVRGTPALTQLFIVYFGFSQLGFTINGFLAAIFGLGLNGAAYVAEIFRSGFLAVDEGQSQAGLALGLTPYQILRHIRIPQALKIMLPPFVSYAVQLIKDTSLASVVAAPEIMFKAKTVVAETYLSMQTYMLVGLLYLSVSIPLSLLAMHLHGRGHSPERRV